MVGISGDRRSAEDTVFGLLWHSKARTALIFEVRCDSAPWPGRYRGTGRQWLAVRDAESTAWMIALPMTPRRSRLPSTPGHPNPGSFVYPSWFPGPPGFPGVS